VNVEFDLRPSLGSRFQQYKWTSAHVLVPLLLGAAFCIAFCVWEAKGAKFPIFPSRLLREPRILALTLIITFISGANFFSVIMFWPTQAFNVYGHDPTQVGIRGIPIGFSILTGACVVLWLLSVFRGHNRELLIASSVIMTAGKSRLSHARPSLHSPDRPYQDAARSLSLVSTTSTPSGAS
jgi:hypothetical protein